MCNKVVNQGLTTPAVFWGVYTIQQTFSKLPASVLKIHVLMVDVCWIV